MKDRKMELDLMPGKLTMPALPHWRLWRHGGRQARDEIKQTVNIFLPSIFLSSVGVILYA
jgi:hypothetical protein